MEQYQPYYVSSLSTNTVVLSPKTTGTCLRSISYPPQESIQQITITTTNAVAAGDFWKSGLCDLLVRIIKRGS